MNKWIFWAGIGFIIGGIVSFSLNAAVESSLSFREDISGYSLGWLATGVVLLAVGFFSNRKKSNS